ncbi:MAG: FAD-binding oxidoreductase, partial [Carnobacterium sp.]|uniref:FAD-binding oxidoreductase n=1 Tax=Carnobacterium sp. TaxID=48221 RepID=UPI002FC6D163
LGGENEMKTFDEEHLAAVVNGEVYTETNKKYENLRMVKNTVFDPHPLAIVKCLNEADVVQTIRYCREQELAFTVKCTGHSAAGFSAGDEKIVIDISSLDQVEVDASTNLVTVGGGANWFKVGEALVPYDLAITSGDMGGVGVGGNAQGSGMGFFIRKYGVTTGRIRKVRVVDATGKILVASETEHPDLFWAIRGGAGNFGVVTEFVFEAHPGGTVLAGNLFYQYDPQLIQQLTDYILHAPDELNGTLSFTTAPFTSQMPEQYKGQLVIALMVCIKGTPAAGNQMIKELKKYSGFLFDEVDFVPYIKLFPPIDPSGNTLMLNFYTNELPDELISELNQELVTTGDPQLVTQVKVLGGYFGRVSNEAMAYSQRENNYLVIMRKAFGSAEEALLANEDWKDKWEQLRKYANGIDINFLGIGQLNELEMMYKPANLKKLKELKQQYDPANCFNGVLSIQ